MITKSGYSITSRMTPDPDTFRLNDGSGNVKRDSTPVLTEEQEKQRREARARKLAAIKVAGPSW